MTEPVLVGQNLTVEFPNGRRSRTIFSSLNFAVRPGAVTAVVGPSGSGKTTLLNLIDRSLAPTAGSVLWPDPAYGTRLSHVFQDARLIPFLNVRENIEFALSLCGGGITEDQIDGLLAELGVAGQADALPRELSGGELQRAAIARSVAVAPLTLLADEPTGALDRANAERIAELLGSLAAEHDLAVVVATHDPAVYAQADEIIDLGLPA
ncbi:MAG: ABC transporter ATP-binding protein [Acidimicrobiales bacterium]